VDAKASLIDEKRTIVRVAMVISSWRKLSAAGRALVAGASEVAVLGSAKRVDWRTREAEQRPKRGAGLAAQSSQAVQLVPTALGWPLRKLLKLLACVGVGWEVFHRKMAAQWHAERRMQQYQQTLDGMPQGVALVGPDGRIEIFNRPFVELLELSPTQFTARPLMADVIDALHARGEFKDAKIPEGLTPLTYFGPDYVDTQPSRFERVRPNGTVLEVRNKKLAGGGFVRTCTDITQSREVQTRITQLAASDALTGLANRRAFHEHLTRMTQRLSRTVKAADRLDEFAILCLDLDRFKAVNDTLGHPVGDLLLQAVAQRLQASIRTTDILARLGGDEFALLLPGASNRASPERVAQRIVDAIRKPFQINDHKIQISVSVGIAMAPQDGADADELLVAADMALYAAKSGGRTTFRVFEKDMTEKAKARRRIELDLERALSQDEFEFHYQPIIDLSNDTIIGFEALARWRHPERGMISPADFISVAEECGLIVQIGEWALRRACRDAMGWPETYKVAVNLSPVQFSSPNLVETISEILTESNLPPHRLELEITETILMQDCEKTISSLHRLKGLGVMIAMDDFGTGYSSLSYLQKFPFDKIKIDRSFVSNIEYSPEQRAIVEAVIHIARALRMETTAEGIETVGQKRILTELRCRQAQGYLFSRPVPDAEIGKFIRGWTKKEHLTA
jgi:diguanylate cyclase (GGDEF)-like protein